MEALATVKIISIFPTLTGVLPRTGACLVSMETLMYSRTTPHSMQQLVLCPAQPAPHVLRITFAENDELWCYEILRTPPSGLSSHRLTEWIDDLTYALNARHRVALAREASAKLYQSVEERQVHAAWLHAHADALTREAKLARTLATRLGAACEAA